MNLVDGVELIAKHRRNGERSSGVCLVEGISSGSDDLSQGIIGDEGVATNLTQDSGVQTHLLRGNGLKATLGGCSESQD